MDCLSVVVVCVSDNLATNGKQFFVNYITKKKLSEDINLAIFEGAYIKDFDYSLLKN